MELFHGSRAIWQTLSVNSIFACKYTSFSSITTTFGMTCTLWSRDFGTGMVIILVSHKYLKYFWRSGMSSRLSALITRSRLSWAELPGRVSTLVGNSTKSCSVQIASERRRTVPSLRMRSGGVTAWQARNRISLNNFCQPRIYCKHNEIVFPRNVLF